MRLLKGKSVFVEGWFCMRQAQEVFLATELVAQSFFSLVFSKRSRKPQKQQGFFSPCETLKTLENKAKTLKKPRNVAAGKIPRKPQKHQGFFSPCETLKTLENKAKTLKKPRNFAAGKHQGNENTKEKKDRRFYSQFSVMLPLV